MLLKTPTSSFQLEIVGYEFPEILNAEYDSNWLLIRITATMPEGTWTVTDPSLLTIDIPELADWLDALPGNTARQDILHFIEPNLSFYFTQSPAGERILPVHLAAECKAPWDRNAPHDTTIDFPIADLDLPSISNNLRSQLAHYPPRPPL